MGSAFRGRILGAGALAEGRSGSDWGAGFLAGLGGKFAGFCSIPAFLVKGLVCMCTIQQIYQAQDFVVYDVTFDPVAVGDVVATTGLVFLGWVRSPFINSRGITSVGLVRLMFLRQTGHWERRGSPGPPRFSPAMRASMRQVWQKRWPGNRSALVVQLIAHPR